MRFFRGLLFASILALAAACSAPRTITSVAPSPQSTAGTYPSGSVVGGVDPLIVATHVLESQGTRWLEPPQARLVQQMSYAEAHGPIPILGEAQDARWPPETRVWLVVFQARWRLLPYGQTQGDPAPTVYSGCGYALLTVVDSAFIAAGDTPCPGHQ